METECLYRLKRNTFQWGVSTIEMYVFGKQRNVDVNIVHIDAQILLSQAQQKNLGIVVFERYCTTHSQKFTEYALIELVGTTLHVSTATLSDGWSLIWPTGLRQYRWSDTVQSGVRGDTKYTGAFTMNALKEFRLMTLTEAIQHVDPTVKMDLLDACKHQSQFLDVFKTHVMIWANNFREIGVKSVGVALLPRIHFKYDTQLIGHKKGNGKSQAPNKQRCNEMTKKRAQEESVPRYTPKAPKPSKTCYMDDEEYSKEYPKLQRQRTPTPEPRVVILPPKPVVKTVAPLSQHVTEGDVEAIITEGYEVHYDDLADIIQIARDMAQRASKEQSRKLKDAIEDWEEYMDDVDNQAIELPQNHDEEDPIERDDLPWTHTQIYRLAQDGIKNFVIVARDPVVAGERCKNCGPTETHNDGLQKQIRLLEQKLQQATVDLEKQTKTADAWKRKADESFEKAALYFREKVGLKKLLDEEILNRDEKDTRPKDLQIHVMPPTEYKPPTSFITLKLDRIEGMSINTLSNPNSKKRVTVPVDETISSTSSSHLGTLSPPRLVRTKPRNPLSLESSKSLTSLDQSVEEFIGKLDKGAKIRSILSKLPGLRIDWKQKYIIEHPMAIQREKPRTPSVIKQIDNLSVLPSPRQKSTEVNFSGRPTFAYHLSPITRSTNQGLQQEYAWRGGLLGQHANLGEYNEVDYILFMTDAVRRATTETSEGGPEGYCPILVWMWVNTDPDVSPNTFDYSTVPQILEEWKRLGAHADHRGPRKNRVNAVLKEKYDNAKENIVARINTIEGASNLILNNAEIFATCDADTVLFLESVARASWTDLNGFKVALASNSGFALDTEPIREEPPKKLGHMPGNWGNLNNGILHCERDKHAEACVMYGYVEGEFCSATGTKYLPSMTVAENKNFEERHALWKAGWASQLKRSHNGRVIIDAPSGQCADHVLRILEPSWKPKGTAHMPAMKYRKLLRQYLRNHPDVYAIVGGSNANVSHTWLDVPIEWVTDKICTGALDMEHPTSKATYWKGDPIKMSFTMEISGTVSDGLYKILHKAGHRVTFKDITTEERVQPHGGHPYMRMTVDLFHIRATNDWISAAIADLRHKDAVTMVDVGSKYATLIPRLRSLATPLDLETQKTINLIMYRPNKEPYDIAYSTKPCDLRPFVWNTEHGLVRVRPTLLREYMTPEDTHQDQHILMTDAHYYFGDIAFKGKKYISGIQHRMLPGLHTFKRGEGWYKVYTDSRSFMGTKQWKVIQKMTGTEIPYQHRLTRMATRPAGSYWDGEHSLFYCYSEEDKPVLNVEGNWDLPADCNWWFEDMSKSKAAIPTLILSHMGSDHVLSADRNNVNEQMAVFKSKTTWNSAQAERIFCNDNAIEIYNTLAYDPIMKRRWMELSYEEKYRYCQKHEGISAWSRPIKWTSGAFVAANTYVWMKNNNPNNLKFLVDEAEHQIALQTFARGELYKPRTKYPFEGASLLKVASYLFVGGLLIYLLYPTVKIWYRDYKNKHNFEETWISSEKLVGQHNTNKRENVYLPQAVEREHEIHHHDTYYKVKPLEKQVEANKNLISLKIDKMVMQELEFASTGKPGPRHVPTGFNVQEGDKIYQPFEWSGSSVQNMMYALLKRQVGTFNFPDDKVLMDFKKFVKQEFRKINPANALEGLTFKEWIQTREYPMGKKLKYIKSEQQTKTDPDWRPSNDYDAMVKVGEVQYTKNLSQDHQVQEGEKSKPRLIMVPGPPLCGTVTYIGSRVIKSAKAAFPEFVHAENSQSFWNKLSPQVQSLGKSVCYSMDMSAHDSHQHHKLIEVVDQYLWKLHRKVLTRVLETEGYHHPEEVIRKIYTRLINNPVAKISLYVNVRNKRKRLGVAKIKGTTFSGNPYLTTLGNTMRVILAHKYAAMRAGIPEKDFVLRVAGDDAVLWLKKKWEKRYEDSVKETFSSDKEDRCHGLGMVLEWSKNNRNRAEFCSKILIANDEYLDGAQWVRKPDSVLFKGNHYAGSDLKFLENPELYAATWAYNLNLETQGPVWTTLAWAKDQMARGTKPDTTYAKCQVLKCKNAPDLNLTTAYYREAAFWLKVSVEQVIAFELHIQYIDWKRCKFGEITVPHPSCF